MKFLERHRMQYLDLHADLSKNQVFSENRSSIDKLEKTAAGRNELIDGLWHPSTLMGASAEEISEQEREHRGQQQWGGGRGGGGMERGGGKAVPTVVPGHHYGNV